MSYGDRPWLGVTSDRPDEPVFEISSAAPRGGGLGANAP